MNRSELKGIIEQAFITVLESQQESRASPQMTEETVLLESGLDSLGFAILVTTLEEQLGYDPFTESDEAYYPVTFAELIDFYHNNYPR